MDGIEKMPIRQKTFKHVHYNNHKLHRNVVYPDPFILTLITDGNGSLVSDITSGFNDDVAHLTATPSAQYRFTNYQTTGASVTGNDIQLTADTTAKANFERYIYNLTLQTNGFGSISASNVTGQVGDTITLTNTPSAGYEFINYLSTGASIQNNTLTMQANDATAKAVFSAQLQPMSVRFQFANTGYDPRYDNYQNYMHNKYPENTAYNINNAWNGGSAAWTQLSVSPNIWDYTYTGDNWNYGLRSWSWLEDGRYTRQPCGSFKILDMNIVGVKQANSMFEYSPITDIECNVDLSTVTSCTRMFQGCGSMKNCMLTNTENIVECFNMFLYCFALTGVPTYVDLPNASACGGMYAYCSAMTTPPTAMNMPKTRSLNGLFEECYNIRYLPHITANSAVDTRDYAYKASKVSANIVETYNRMTSQQVTVTDYTGTFYKCGNATTQGAAELAQIPSAWKQGDPRRP